MINLKITPRYHFEKTKHNYSLLNFVLYASLLIKFSFLTLLILQYDFGTHCASIKGKCLNGQVLWRALLKQ